MSGDAGLELTAGIHGEDKCTTQNLHTRHIASLQTHTRVQAEKKKAPSRTPALGAFGTLDHLVDGGGSGAKNAGT